MKKLILLLVVSLFIYGCNENSERNVELVFVFDKPLEEQSKYPEIIQKLNKSFSSSCNVDLYFKPIGFIRIDISKNVNRINSWKIIDENIESSAGEKTIDYCNTWLESYYKKNTPDKIFFDSSKESTDIGNWILNCKDSLLIYNESSENGIQKPTFSNIEDLKKKIEEYVCNSQVNKIYIVVNPTFKTTQPLPEPKIPVDKTPVEVKPSIPKDKVEPEFIVVEPVKSSSPCPNKITGSSLEDCFYKLADANIPRECKSNLKSQAIGYFESSDSRVVNVNNNGDRISGEWSISTYCESLMTNHRPTFIYQKEKDGSKISILKITVQ